jgi:hypothetical protein
MSGPDRAVEPAELSEVRRPRPGPETSGQPHCLRDRELALHHWQHAPGFQRLLTALSAPDGGRLGDAILLGMPGSGAVHPVIGSGGPEGVPNQSGAVGIARPSNAFLPSPDSDHRTSSPLTGLVMILFDPVGVTW